MATDPDVLELVAILDTAGFGAVAGELLTEIALGREPDLPDEAATSSDDATTAGKEIEDDESASGGGRIPIADSEQFTFAMTFLKARLVDPALALGEAERLAGTLNAPQGKPVPIRFAPAEGEDDPPPLTRMPGDDAVARKLENVLRSLPIRRGPDRR